MPIVVFAVLAFGGLSVFYRLGPVFERWSVEQYGEVESQ
jgi:hypothetical protein